MITPNDMEYVKSELETVNLDVGRAVDGLHQKPLDVHIVLRLLRTATARLESLECFLRTHERPHVGG